MTTTITTQPFRTRRVRGTAARIALAAGMAFAVLVPAGAAQARLETPQDTTHQAAAAKAGPTRVAGRYGVHVTGGWVLR